MPDHDALPPDQIEAYARRAGLRLQRRSSRLLIARADQALVRRRRHGKAGQGGPRRGARPEASKTTSGEVTVARTRISRRYDGALEIPSAPAWDTPHQLAITQDPRDAACDLRGAHSAEGSRVDVCQDAGGEELLGRSTILEIVHREGARLVAAQRQRARAVLDDASEADLAVLGSLAAEDVREEPSDVPPCDESEGAQAEWDQVLAEWTATGFPGCEPASPVPADQPRDIDPGYVIIEPDEVKTKAQPTTGRKEVWTYTAVAVGAGWSYCPAEATAEGLWSQVGALLLELGGLSGERRLLVSCDGAAWIRTWFEGLVLSPKAMIVCWWHLRKRCYEQLSSAGGPKDRPRALEKDLLGQLWAGRVDAALTCCGVRRSGCGTRKRWLT